MGLTQPKLVIVPGKRAFNYARLVAINVFISCYNYEKREFLNWRTGKILSPIISTLRRVKHTRAHAYACTFEQVRRLRYIEELVKFF